MEYDDFYLIWESCMSDMSFMYWYYNFNVNRFKVLKRRVDVSKTGLIDNDTFLAKFLMSKQFVTNSEEGQIFGIRLVKAKDASFFIGHCNNEFVALIKPDYMVCDVINKSGCFSLSYRDYINCFIYKNIPLVVARLIVENQRFRNKFLEYMVFLVRYSNSPYSCVDLKVI